MLVFWLIIAAFAVPILLWVIYPLLKIFNNTDAKTATSKKIEPSVFFAVFLVVSVLFGSVYTYLERSTGYNTMVALEAMEQRTEKLLELIEEEKKNLKENPDNPLGWVVLAQAHQALNQYSAAADAYAEVERLDAMDSDELSLAYAETLILAEKEYPKARQLLENILLRSPNQRVALYLYGSLEFKNGSYREAIARWQALKEAIGDTLPPQWHRELLQMIQTAEMHAQTLEANGQKDTIQKPEQLNTRPLINIYLSLSKELEYLSSPSDTVFVYARDASSPMPIAIHRFQVMDLPRQVSLSDSDAMLPSLLLSNFKQVQVFARVSKSGNARQQAGDFFGTSQTVTIPKAGENPIKMDIVINRTAEQ